MKTRVYIGLFLFLLLGSSLAGVFNPPGSPANADAVPGISEDIAAAFRTGNATSLSRFLNQTIDLSLPGHESTCSKQQAEQILKSFFIKYPPKSFKINHQGASRDGSQFYIGSYLSDKGISFRIYFLMKKQQNTQLIHQIQIDEE